MNDDFCTKLSQLSINGTVEEIVLRFMEHLKFDLGKDQFSAAPYDCYISFASAVKDILLDRWLITQPQEYALQRKRVYYLSSSIKVSINSKTSSTIMPLLSALNLTSLKQIVKA